MPQIILPRSDNGFGEEKVEVEHIEEELEYQVDTFSTSSMHSDDDTDTIDENNTIAVNNKPHLPHFGSVNVVNSNDVHFGNKTVYKGPVTIKQFVYPNGNAIKDKEFDPSDPVISTENGVINPGFENDVKVSTFGSKEEFVERETEADNNANRQVTKGLKWLKTILNGRIKEIILVCIGLAILVTTICIVMFWKNPSISSSNEDDIVPIEYTSDSNATEGRLRIINRLLWLAQPPSGPINALKLPVSLLIVHHTATEGCISQAQCVFQMRHMQTFHMESNGWSDIGYNFAIGGDGAVYEGRSWNKEGAHTLGWNNISIGVAFIGTYNSAIPAPNMLSAFQKLLETGRQLGHLAEDFKIMGARQFSGTESPGKVFYNFLKTWKRWSDLKDLKIKKA